MANDNDEGNIKSEDFESRPWSKKEMDESEPYPIPEINGDNEKDNQNDQND